MRGWKDSLKGKGDGLLGGRRGLLETAHLDAKRSYDRSATAPGEQPRGLCHAAYAGGS